MASQLSPRQREIVNLVAEGRTSKEIAVTLGISESTVNWHLANAFERLGASSRAEAVALAMRSNGADRVTVPEPRVRTAPVGARTPRLVAIAVAIAIAGALLGAATAATLRLGPAAPSQRPTAPPANGSQGMPTSSPSSGYRLDLGGGEIGDGMSPDFSRDHRPRPQRGAPRAAAVPLPTLALPSAPVTLPPLPSILFATLPAIPTRRLSFP